MMHTDDLLRTAPTNADRLTKRQIECLTLIAAGLTTAQAAGRLGLSTRTAEHYLSGACARLGVRTRTHAVTKAISLGLIPNPAASN